MASIGTKKGGRLSYALLLVKWRKLIEFFSRHECNCFRVAADRGRRTTKRTLTNKPSVGEICAQIYALAVIALRSWIQTDSVGTVIPGYCQQQTWRTRLEKIKWHFGLRSHENEEQKRCYYHSPFPLGELNVRIMLPSIKNARRWALAGGIPPWKTWFTRIIAEQVTLLCHREEKFAYKISQNAIGPLPAPEKEAQETVYSRNYL